MSQTQHYRNLESMYAAAPINEFYLPSMTVTEGEAVIEIQASKKHQHSGGGVHGSVYFKMLDDETGEMLEVKIRCSKKISDAMEGFEPKESKKVFKKCLKELENRGLVRG